MTNKLLFVVLATAIPATAAAENNAAQPAPQAASKAKITKVAGFEYGETYVHTKQRAELQKLAKEWKASPAWTTITVEGHGFVDANEEHSIQLGQLRADRVRKLLVKYGVDPKFIVAVGHSRSERGRYVEVSVEECVAEGCRR